MSKIAIIRIRGLVRINHQVRDTLIMLKLHRKNYCTVYESTPSIIGMIKKVKDYVAYGDIDNNTYNTMLEKRGEDYKGPVNERTATKYITYKERKLKPYFRLSPPKGGFGSIKKSIVKGGALGFRKDMDQLIQRML
ncbi:MAG: uL30 family ribosomal protein [Nanoarchaeota archaeon]|nr:uL30 family ribosomal protein [Nanoarchaeota archaeon]MBU1704664.1 uL30 family ribosomal protein [Nanoarchaeota archaeon]